MSTPSQHEPRQVRIFARLMVLGSLAVGAYLGFAATRDGVTLVAIDARPDGETASKPVSADSARLSHPLPEPADAASAPIPRRRPLHKPLSGAPDSQPVAVPKLALAATARHDRPLSPASPVNYTTASAAVGANALPARSEAARGPRQQFNGIVFLGRADQISLVKVQMQALLDRMGWTAGQVVVREPVGGERISFMLEGAPNDTNTFDLCQRPALGILPEVIRYTTRLGQRRKLAIPSQKEILAAMLQRGRTFVFSGPDCMVARLTEQIALRQNIVYWGSRADWAFPQGSGYRYNVADYWQPMIGDDWTLKPDVGVRQAVADAFVGKFSYQMGCTSACRFIYAHGILDFYHQVCPTPTALARLEQMLDRERPFTGIAPQIDRQTRAVIKEGRLMDRHADVPWNNWVPGDWGWIKNPDDKSSEDLGNEGCNLIYAGGGLFVNYYPERMRETLDQALNRVYGWRFGLEQAELVMPADLLEQLRQDPRSGGMLRDVRDFPKCFSSGPLAPPPQA